jgi:Uncharacterized protein conserved in bacteria
MTTVFPHSTAPAPAAKRRFDHLSNRRSWSGLRPLGLAFGAFLAACVASAGDAKAQLSGDMLGRPHTYKTHYDDTLLDIARDARLGGIELMAANPGVDPWLPGTDVTLLLPTAHLLPDAPRKGIVINTAELRLYYFGDPAAPLSFPIGVGRDGYLTPHGTTKIARKKENPSWYLTPSEIADHPELPPVIPPGPDNPLGEHALYLGWPTYLIHGTNVPWGIGRRASRGCIRMYPESIAWLFDRVPIGTPVTVVEQHVKLGRMDGDLYIEVQPSSKQIDTMEETSKAPAPPEPLPVAEWSDRILLAAGPDIERLDWPAVEKALTERQGYPVRIATSAEHAGTVALAASPVEKPTLATVALPGALAAAAAAGAVQTDSKPDASQKASAAPAETKTATEKPAASAKPSAKQATATSPAPTPAPARSAKATTAQSVKAPQPKPSVPAKTTVARNAEKPATPVAKPTPAAKPNAASGQQRTASR